MPYKIAIATSDNLTVDQHFGSADRFVVYEAEGTEWRLLEERKASVSGLSDSEKNCTPKADCNGAGCGNGEGHGNCQHSDSDAKVDLVTDCRAVVAVKIGRPVLKLLERKAISAFDVSCPVEEALQKITFYYNKIDSHQGWGKR